MNEQDDILVCANAAEWELWFSKYHNEAGGVWLVIAKKGSGKAVIGINEALDAALCYGWIDSQRKGHDANHYLQRYSPRRARSPWSKLNVERVIALITAKRMRAPGLTEVEAARGDGRWKAAYVSQRNVDLPPDFVSALKKNPQANTAFAQLSKTARYALLLPILKATTPMIRTARLKRLSPHSP